MKKILSLLVLGSFCVLNLFAMGKESSKESSFERRERVVAKLEAARNPRETSRFHLGAILSHLMGMFLCIETIKVDNHSNKLVEQEGALVDYMSDYCMLWGLLSIWTWNFYTKEELEKQYPGLKEKALEIWEEGKYSDKVSKAGKTRSARILHAKVDLIRREFLRRVGTEYFKLSENLNPATALEYFLPVAKIRGFRKFVEEISKATGHVGFY